jgi:hypothetical protein
VRIIDAWIIHADDEGKRAEGRRLLLTAVLVFEAFYICGIVSLLYTI